MKPRSFRKFSRPERGSWRSNRNLHGAFLSAARVLSTVTSVLFCELCHHLSLSTDLQRAVRHCTSGYREAPSSCPKCPQWRNKPWLPCVCSVLAWVKVGLFFFLYVTVYSYFSKKRVFSVCPVGIGSAPNWLWTTDTSDFPLNPVLSGSFLWH